MPPLRVLHAIHDFLPRHRAGSEIYAAALAGELQRAHGHHVTVLAAEYDPAREHGTLHWRIHDGLPVVELINNWAFRSFEETYRSPELGAVLGHVLDAVEPNVVHVHNLLNLSFELPAMARARGAAVVATLHDYTLVCPSGGQRLHRAENHVCHEIDVERCARCFPRSAQAAQMRLTGGVLSRPGGRLVARLAAAARRRTPALVERLGATALKALPGPSVDAGAVKTRLAAAREAFESLDLVAAPSRSIARELAALGFPGDRVVVRDYGFPPLRRLDRRPADRPLRIGYVGSLVRHKGAHILVASLRRLPPGSFQAHVWGDPRVERAYVAELTAAARGLPVTWHGRHDGDPAAVYAQIDVLVVPSLWLENSPLVVHEAFQCGVPVVASRIGGLAGLVRDGVDGLLVPPGDADELAATLSRLAGDRSLITRLAAAAPPVPSLADDARAWSRDYERLADPEGQRTSVGRPQRRLAAVVLNYRTPDETQLAAFSLAASRRPLDDLAIVDNDPAGSGEPAARAAGAEHLPLGVNRGFAGGMNAGLKWAFERGADATLLVNSDARVTPATVGRLESALDEHPRAGLLAPVVLSRRWPGAIDSAGLDFSAASGRVRLAGHGRPLAELTPARWRAVPAVAGGVVVVTRELFERAGGFDEGLFFSFEDLELSLRARRLGFEVGVAGDAIAYHESGGTIGARSPLRLYYAARNHPRAATVGAPLGAVRSALRITCIVALNLGAALRGRSAPRFAGLAAVARGTLDYLRGRCGPAPAAITSRYSASNRAATGSTP